MFVLRKIWPTHIECWDVSPNFGWNLDIQSVFLGIDNSGHVRVTMRGRTSTLRRPGRSTKKILLTGACEVVLYTLKQSNWPHIFSDTPFSFSQDSTRVVSALRHSFLLQFRRQTSLSRGRTGSLGVAWAHDSLQASPWLLYPGIRRLCVPCSSAHMVFDEMAVRPLL